MRRPPVGSLPPQAQQQWVVQPLVDVGLGRAEIETLLFRLAFAAVVGEDLLACSVDLVADRPQAVRTAWRQTLHRLLALDLDDDGPVG